MNEDCVFCEEPIHGEPARGTIYTDGVARHAHSECHLRMALGGIGHLIAHDYWCTQKHDPDAGLTYRQSALLAAAFVDHVGVNTAVSRI